ncbi:Ig-like domain-containing protein [Streptomyces sp. NPDC051322]|uniref:Ig-like domain-containing protein n=1 Tax=Streptomyces sp. NPDC051322 TaxID=3154645 RepID=UPI0034508D6F
MAVEGLEYFPAQRWFRVRADPGANASGIVSLQVKEPTGAPRLRPQIRVAVPDGSGRKLIRTGPLSDASVLVGAATAPGLRLLMRPGDLGSVNVLAGMAGSSPISVTQPVHGTAQLAADGWVSYQAPTGFAGYDRFHYTVATADGRKSSAPVNVHVGELDAVPGAFPEYPATTEFRGWQWPELSGRMPWPRLPGTAPSPRGQTW